MTGTIFSRSVPNQLSSVNVPGDTIQEYREDLATLLGEMLEAKMRGRNIIDRLDNLQ